MNHAVVTSLATVTSFPWPTVMPDRLPRILELWGQSHLVDVGRGLGGERLPRTLPKQSIHPSTGTIRPLQDPSLSHGQKRECPSKTEQNQNQFSNVKDWGTGNNFVSKHPRGLCSFPFVRTANTETDTGLCENSELV